MALHKTDYGLVYDDEGSLCVTKRTDDVPFPGTTAWAVETGTTNEVTDQDYLGLYTGAEATNELVTLNVVDRFSFNGVVNPTDNSTIENPYGIRLYNIKFDLFLYDNFEQYRAKGGF